MNIPTTSRERQSRIARPPSYNDNDLLGGEPLEGSGFEAQEPEPGFQFDWPTATAHSKGGDQ
jgi:hypothetical protein